MTTIPFMRCAEGSYCDQKADWCLEEQPPGIDLNSMYACDEHLASVIKGFTEHFGLDVILVWPYKIGED